MQKKTTKIKRNFCTIVSLLSIAIALASLGGCTVSPPTYSPPQLAKAIDPDGDNDDKGLSYFPHIRPATGSKVFIFDPNYGAWAAYNETGVLVDTGKASGGSMYCKDLEGPCRTIIGEYRVLWKGDATCISHKFPLDTHGGAPMPYCMYFNYHGYAIHGSDELPDYNASHGCVRVTPLAAKWLNENFMDVGSHVIILPYAPSRSNSSST